MPKRCPHRSTPPNAVVAELAAAEADGPVSDADRWTERYGGWTPDQVSRMALLCGWLLARHRHATIDGLSCDRADCWGCRLGFELMRDLMAPETGP